MEDLFKDDSGASELCGENTGIRDPKTQKEYAEMWRIFSSDGRISSPFTSEDAFENEGNNSEHKSFVCLYDTESNFAQTENTSPLKRKNIPYQNVLSTSLQWHGLNSVPYSHCGFANFNHFDDKISISQDHGSSRPESDCFYLQNLSPLGPSTCANGQVPFNSRSHLVFSQSNTNYEIACKENNPFNTVNRTIQGQSNNSQLSAEKAPDLISSKSLTPYSGMGPEPTYGLGYLFSKLSCFYKDTGTYLFNSTMISKQIKELGNLCDKSRRSSQVVSLIKNLPFVRNLQVDILFNSGATQDISRSTNGTKAQTDNVLQLESPVQEHIPVGANTEILDVCAGKPTEGFVCHYENEKFENSLVLRQNFVHFPDILLKLQVCSLEKVLEYLTCALPQICIGVEELKGIYWLAVGNCTSPDPEPACLLLFRSVLYVVVLSIKQEVGQNSLEIFHKVPVITIEEIQVGFAGQHIRLLCSTEDNLLTIFTYDKHFTQRICHDILSVLISATDNTVYLNHQLLGGDLLQVSLDWASEVNDLVFPNGVRLSCKFRSVLADLVYLLHENMGSNKPSLGDVCVLLYTTVKIDCFKQAVYRSLVLTTTHIGVLRENAFYSAPNVLNTSSQRSQFDNLQLYSLNDLRCVVVPDKENMTKIELVFSRSKVGTDSGTGFSKRIEKEINPQLTVIPSFLQNSLHLPSEIWKLTFSSSEEAIWLIRHLTRC
ncbi:PREDICTED: uncharacterized protein LOC104580133 [Tinamus guttatus]|uniref:uncharacterized protein LOC104580133 n=1 Tax=Tinamus guttatus TaxID=94827 RepID=UPI00052EADC6|nr:PREDICTED: uncharacterized protein LOC104580133 [Tinamus guttatus]